MEPRLLVLPTWAIWCADVAQCVCWGRGSHFAPLSVRNVAAPMWEMRAYFSDGQVPRNPMCTPARRPRRGAATGRDVAARARLCHQAVPAHAARAAADLQVRSESICPQVQCWCSCCCVALACCAVGTHCCAACLYHSLPRLRCSLSSVTCHRSNQGVPSHEVFVMQAAARVHRGG